MVVCSYINQAIQATPKGHHSAHVCMPLSHTAVASAITQLFVERATWALTGEKLAWGQCWFGWLVGFLRGCFHLNNLAGLPLCHVITGADGKGVPGCRGLKAECKTSLQHT